MERKKKRAASPEELATLTEPRKQFSLKKPNRIKQKSQRKLIEMNKRYFFYFKNGICHYRKKAS